MSVFNNISKHLWLVDTLRRRDGMTREEISRAWQNQSLGEHGGEIAERTFYRYIKEIKNLFGIEIKYNRRERAYYIANREDLNQENFKSWILDGFALNTLLHDSQHLKKRIIFEPVPSGQKFLPPLIEAVRDNAAVDINYRSFYMDGPAHHVVEPYCVKACKQRWYLIGRRAENNLIRTFALDRIESINRTGQTFDMPVDFDAELYFRDSIGIAVDENVPPRRVVIKVEGISREYLRTLPLHHSQNEIETGEANSIFELYVRPSDEFIQELLRYGCNVTVVSPQWLREKMAEIVKQMNDNYNL